MIFYLGSPNNQMQADWCRDMPVLISYAVHNPWVDDYIPSFRRVIVDSGAFSEYNSGKKIDGGKYKEWVRRFEETVHVDAVAGLDDIGGDWKKSLRNYEKYGGFPTFHESDPPELLDELIPLARERGKWIGLGLIPPRAGKWDFVKAALRRMPSDLHVHFWAGGEYCGHPRVDSCDSVHWFMTSFAIKVRALTDHLTPAECVEIMVKRYQRMSRKPVPVDNSVQEGLFQ